MHSKLKVGQLVYINEEQAGIRYHNSHTKGKRPFVVYKFGFSTITLIPISSVPFSRSIETRVNNNKSYIILDLPLIIKISKCIELQKDPTNFQIFYNVKVMNERQLKEIRQYFKNKF